MVNPLLEHLYPITSEMVFINNNIEAVTEAYYDWLVNIYKEKEAKITKEEKKLQNLEAALLQLVPLDQTTHTKTLLIATKDNSWTALFDNSWSGTDTQSTPYVLSKKLNNNAIAITYTPNYTYPAAILQFYTPLDNIGPAKWIGSMIQDNDTWYFNNIGIQFDFEDITTYKKRKKKNRFTPEILQYYAQQLGIDPFNEQFYDTTKVYLISKQGKLPNSWPKATLQETQKNFGFRFGYSAWNK